jgi:hypothetical protein
MRVRLIVAVIALVASAALASSGCAARRFDALMQSWQGHTVNDLFRTWGRPAYLYSDGSGGQIAIYVPAASAATTAAASNAAAAPRNGPRQPQPLREYDPRMIDSWPVFRMFFIDDTGRIVRSRWRGRWECCSS